MTALNESTAEDGTLAWLEEMGYAVLHGRDIAAGEPAADRPRTRGNRAQQRHHRLDHT